MDWFSGIVLYFIIWWTSIFAVFPFGLERDEKGFPVNVRIGRKFLINTVVAAVIWAIIAYLIHIELINFRELGAQMMEES